MGLSSKQVSMNAPDWAQQTLLQATPLKQQQQQKEPPLKCPRCESMNTKFCYYNNYNRSQPRYYCKSCKRHWTQGGNLRNVPVGGSRRNKRLKTSNTCEQSLNQGVEDHTNNSMDSTPSLPFCLPNFSFTNLTSFDNAPSSISSSSSYFNGEIQASSGYERRGVSGSVEDPCSRASMGINPYWQLPSATSFVDSLNSNLSWEDFNTLISTDMKQPWDGSDLQELGI